ncbi:MAG: LysR family transcriptional regulator, partial [Clostridiales bacterium]|nr:LysR family transcriptional regulator [Clostridiales bacterium]
MYISYDYYRIFYYVARYGSITHAAKLLLNSQPNLTRAIKTLESELGCPLFIRNNRGMALTSEGERLFDRVAVAMENIEAGEAEIIASRNMEKGSVYVAASELALHCALLPVLKAYRAQHPGVRLKISNHSTPQAADAIKNGTADIAVVTTPTLPAAAIEEISVCKFREVAVCGSAYSDLFKSKISIAELLAHPIISLGPHTKSFEL